MNLFLKNLLFTLLVPGTVAVYLPLWIARTQSPSAGIARVTAWFLVVAGAAIYAGSQWNFAVSGRGTPAPIDAPKKLVIRGPYRYVRNPMYVAVLTTILGWSLLFHTTALIGYAVVVGISVHLFIVFYEEPHLVQEFGSEYEAYLGQVGRWFPQRGGKR